MRFYSGWVVVVLEAEAVLFDSDGVLIDSHRVVETAWRQLAAEFHLDADRLIREQPGVRAGDTLSRHLSPGRTRHAVARLEDLEVDLAEQVEPLPGALDLTRQIPAMRWAIVTSASRRLATARWVTVGIEVPPTTVTADDVSTGKPDPTPYFKAADLLEVEPTRCVVVEDSPSGGLAASALGATVVAVGDQRWATEPNIRIHDLTQIKYNEPEHADRPATLTVDPRP
jgi:sugar-phosphatase